jgi:hypothetical protein
VRLTPFVLGGNASQTAPGRSYRGRSATAAFGVFAAQPGILGRIEFSARTSRYSRRTTATSSQATGRTRGSSRSTAPRGTLRRDSVARSPPYASTARGRAGTAPPRRSSRARGPGSADTHTRGAPAALGGPARCNTRPKTHTSAILESQRKHDRATSSTRSRAAATTARGWRRRTPGSNMAGASNPHWSPKESNPLLRAEEVAYTGAKGRAGALPLQGLRQFTRPFGEPATTITSRDGDPLTTLAQLPWSGALPRTWNAEQRAGSASTVVSDRRHCSSERASRSICSSFERPICNRSAMPAWRADPSGRPSESRAWRGLAACLTSFRPCRPCRACRQRRLPSRAARRRSPRSSGCSLRSRRRSAAPSG